MVKTLLADKEDRIAAMEGLISRCAIYCSIHYISKPDIRITQQHIECRKQLESDLAIARSNAEMRENEKVTLQVKYGIFNIASKSMELILIQTSVLAREAFRISRCFKPNGGERRNDQSPGGKANGRRP
jgi:hypothetical protein